MWELKEPAGRFFAPGDKAAVAALFEAILPGGADNPGATDVGAADYVDRLLAMDGSTYYDIENWRPLYTAGLAMLTAASGARFGGRGIGELAAVEVTELLTKLAAGELSGFPTPDWQRRFFGVLRDHCIEGCFADPRWGGNRDNVMWQWFGYPTGPAAPFDRGIPGGGLPKNPAPPGARPPPSGNAATAVKDPSELQSATVAPELLTRAINARRREP